MSKRITTISVFLLISLSTFCQRRHFRYNNQNHSHTIYFEAGGPALLYSLNYEHGVAIGNKGNKFNGRIGVCYIEELLSFPVGVSVDLGKGKNSFQINYNCNFAFEDYRYAGLFTSSIGIALVRRPDVGRYYHVSLLAVNFKEGMELFGMSFNTMPWIGIGTGYVF